MLRITLFMLLLCSFLAPDPAQARGAVRFGQHESLILTAPTNLQGPNGPMALCRHTHMRTMMFMGYWLEQRGFALSDQACEGTEFYDLPANMDPGNLTETGLAAALSPPLILHYLRGFFWIYAGVFLLIAAVYIKRRGTNRSDIRRKTLALEDGPVFRFIDAMCHAAKIDGTIDPAETQYITNLARQLTNRDYTTDHIEYAIAHCDRLNHPTHFRQFAHGLDPRQKGMVMRGVLSVIHADTKVTRAEKTFLRLMGKALGLTKRDMRALMQT